MNNSLPKSNKKLVLALLSYILCPVVVLVLFQNCGKKEHSTEGIASLGSGELIIPDPEPDPEPDVYTRKIQANQIVANRILMSNYFISIFGKEVETSVTNLIATQAGDFGSGMSIYDRVITSTTDCSKTKNIYSPCNTVAIKLDAPPTIGANIRREAFRVRACSNSVKTNVLNALKKFDSKATTTKPPEINDANLTKAFHLFYRGRAAPNTEVLDSLLILSEKSAKPIDKWKDIILSICLSPHWQVL
jgi:hypothetical protein